MFSAETAEFFFVDTTPFVVSYFFEKDHTYDWQGVFPRGTYLANLLNVDFLFLICFNFLIKI